MRRATWLVLAIGAAGTLLTSAACRTVTRLATDPMPLRVLVWNIHVGTDAGGAATLDRIARLIDSTGADVALLQEVDRRTSRSAGVDQIARLAALTSMQWAFGRTLDYQGGEYGLAILSRWPIVRDTLIPLPVDPPQTRAGGSVEPRGVLLATLRAPRGEIDILNTHLDPSRDDAYRRQEVAQLLLTASRRAAEARVVLVGGDFNAEPGSEVVAMVTRSSLRDVWAGCGAPHDGLTYPADEPVKRIDYLFAPTNVRCDSTRVLVSTASDHRPILFHLGALFPVREAAPIQYDPRTDSLRPPSRRPD